MSNKTEQVYNFDAYRSEMLFHGFLGGLLTEPQFNKLVSLGLSADEISSFSCDLNTGYSFEELLKDYT